MPRPGKALQGIQSVEIAGDILAALARDRQPMPLGKLAQEAGMTASKARRYLVSLCRIGMVQQDAVSGHYSPGPLAFKLGRASLGRRSVLPVALPEMRLLRDQLNETVSLLVWGPMGPTVLHYEESDQPVRLNTSVGSLLPILTSASGQIFGAFLPRGKTAKQIAAELSALRRRGRAGVARIDRAEVEKIFDEARKHGMTRGDGTVLPTVGALGVPIFDMAGELVAGMVVIGHRGSIDLGFQGRVARSLLATAQRISAGI